MDEQIIMERTGHTSVMGARAYKRTSDVLINQISLHHHNQMNITRKTADSQVNSKNDSERGSKTIKCTVANNFYFSNCTVTNKFFGINENDNQNDTDEE